MRLSAHSVVGGMVMGTFLETAPLSLSSMSENSRSVCPSWLGIVASGPGVYFGMAGCLVLVLLVSATLGQQLLQMPLISEGSPCKQHQGKFPSPSQRGCGWWCHLRHEPPNWRRECDCQQEVSNSHTGGHAIHGSTKSLAA